MSSVLFNIFQFHINQFTAITLFNFSYFKAIKKIISGVPLQHITHMQEFMKMNFYVDENVLIPRSDTEILVEEVINISKKINAKKILDLCTGSGAIAISLARYIENSEITAVDISKKALEIARTNAKNNDVENQITFVESDLFKNLKEDKYDVILLHDVIEHVPTKELFLVHLRKFLKTKGVLFVGFPAWQMPFGGHQQICRSKLCSHLPFIHLLSNPLYKLLLKTCNEEKGTINELMSIKDCRTSIELFERLIHQCGFSVTDQKLWFNNPHYKQKFHLTPRLLPHWVWRVKYIRNFFTTSCWYVLSIGNKEKF